MAKFILEVLLFAITITFLLAWGYVKKQRKADVLVKKLYENCEKKILKGFENRDILSKKEIETIIKGTKASLFWSNNKAIVQDGKFVIDTVLEGMMRKGIIVEENPGKKRAFRFIRGS